VPVPRLGLLTYAAPIGIRLEPGMRVLAPLGARTITGCIVDVVEEAAPVDGLKTILRVLDEQPLVPADVVKLAQWAADYYLCGPGETLAAALPPMARQRADAFKRQRVARITPEGAAVDRGSLTDKQRAAIALVAEAVDGVTLRDLESRQVTAAVIGGLAKRGLVAIERETVDRDPFVADEAGVGEAGATEAGGHAHGPGASGSPFDVEPTTEQRDALTTLTGLASEQAFSVALLHGVTGSGKTQVYLRLADAVRRHGRGVLLLVPEIALTPALAALVRRAFGDRVAIQHSGLSEGERHDQWHRIRRGDVDVVVGTRSAVFAPLQQVGLIVVDEEHDTSYKQDESPRYHGRDVAIVRGREAGALVVLGSATPSLESFQHAQSGRYRLLTLERRVLDRPLASVSIVDMREELAEQGPDVVLSGRLRKAIGQRLEAGEQSLVLLNRRGYATALFCRQCAATLECPNCSITLTVHRSAARARCHYCDHEVRVPERCVSCAGEFLEYRGVGTERIEAEIRDCYPDARIARVDRDTVRRRGAIARVLRRFARRELDVLVGTQMIAKGHDFPEVTLVGVVSADVGLGVADFRAAERTFQLLTQVVGRAGRGARQGEAYIQTLYPNHYSIRHAAKQDYRAFYDRELEYRRSMHYPPSLSMVSLVVKAPSPGQAIADAARIARQLRHAASSFDVLGPAPAPLSRLRGEHRVQIFLKGTHRAAMRQAVIRALDAHRDLARRVTVDVDPLSML
jgi:primosomal protein N' (replication factor Y) (superfamily II helicase)